MAMNQRESKAVSERMERMAAILPILKKSYPTAHCSLDHRDPLQLIVATILSAQCTDDRVNLVTKDLLQKYRTAADYAKTRPEQLEQDIKSTGFYRNKAKSIRAMAQSLIEKHDGKVPDTMEALVDLAGVGRKTANVVLGNAFGKNEGVVVDTHVGRLSGRLKLTRHTDPVKIEQDLMQVVPREDWALFAHLMIYHGRAVCQARKPRCAECPIRGYCPSADGI
jgi:endonuclease-3